MTFWLSADDIKDHYVTLGWVGSSFKPCQLKQSIFYLPSWNKREHFGSLIPWQWHDHLCQSGMDLADASHIPWRMLGMGIPLPRAGYKPWRVRFLRAQPCHISDEPQKQVRVTRVRLGKLLFLPTPAWYGGFAPQHRCGEACCVMGTLAMTFSLYHRVQGRCLRCSTGVNFHQNSQTKWKTLFECEMLKINVTNWGWKWAKYFCPTF